MRLLFAYFDYSNPSDGTPSDNRLGECALNLSVEYDFRVDKTTEANGRHSYKLSYGKRPEDVQLPTGFWGERIYNVTALIGENGTGKSTLLIGIIKAVVKGLDPGAPFLLVFQKTGSEELSIYQGGGLAPALEEPLLDLSLSGNPTDEYPDTLKKTKVMLVDNALTLTSLGLDQAYSDIQTTRATPIADEIAAVPANETVKQLFNKSLVASMRYSDEICNAGRPMLRDTFLVDTVRAYFQYESFQEARYLFDPFIQTTIKSLRNEGHPFPCPTYLYITTYEIWQLHSIFGARHELQRHENQPFPEALQRFGGTGFFESLLACTLYLLYVSFLHTPYEGMAQEWFNESYFQGDSAPLFDEAGDFATFILDRTSFAIEAGSLIPERSKKNIASCRSFLRFIIENQSALRGIFLPAPEGGQGDSNSRTRRINIENVLGDLEKRRCVSGFLDNYRMVTESEYYLTFSCGLSSGEKSLFQLLAHFRYALAGPRFRPEDSAPGEYEPDALVNWFPTAGEHDHEDHRERERVTCDTLLLFLDEADLTYHPEWQRQYVRLLTVILPKMFRDPYGEECAEGCKDIQVILTTHSPLLLSDIPQQSCIFLVRDGERNVVANNPTIQRTFGANVHDLLRNAFFSSGP